MPVSSSKVSASEEKTIVKQNLSTLATSSAEPPVSIDEILKESVTSGQLSSEELDKIHRIIGYDPSTTTQQREEDMSVVPSRQGVQRAWEKLSTQLENLEFSRNDFIFQQNNSYMISSTSDESLAALSHQLFAEGNIHEAILASEAHVRKDPENSEGQFTTNLLAFTYIPA